jgi:mycofactocin glycosyltransferase
MVAPRIRSTPGPAALARFETTRSPLDLGPHASLVGPGRRIGYLPAATMLARREVLLEIGGFDESLRFGEDVDLVWRLLAAGRRVRYAPQRTVGHRPRSTVGGFARQRAGYGGSAPDLAARHGAAVAPLQGTAAMAAGWAAGAVLGPRAWLAAAGLAAAGATRRGKDADERRARFAIAVAGQAGGVTHLSRALCREWLPIGCALATTRRGRKLMLIACLIDTLPVVAQQRPADLPAALGLHALDRTAYATGLWKRTIAVRDPRALLPRLSPGN